MNGSGNPVKRQRQTRQRTRPSAVPRRETPFRNKDTRATSRGLRNTEATGSQSLKYQEKKSWTLKQGKNVANMKTFSDGKGQAARPDGAPGGKLGEGAVGAPRPRAPFPVWQPSGRWAEEREPRRPPHLPPHTRRPATDQASEGPVTCRGLKPPYNHRLQQSGITNQSETWGVHRYVDIRLHAPE